MQVQQSIPAKESRRHDRTLDCPCRPSQTVTAAPHHQPTVIITHHPLTTRSKR